MPFYVEPEVAGGLGERTVLDTAVHPPRVERLQYEFAGWLGDPLLESFPCFIATEPLAAALDAAHASGVRWAPVEVSLSEEFREQYPGREVPPFRWLRVTGAAGVDDFGLAPDHRLVVSDRALAVLRDAGMQHAVVEEFQPV